MSTTNNQKGFSLIELVIVLAIAALILTGVFLAVGGAQRGQRDTARKNMAGRVSDAIANYASNNNGKIAAFGGDCTSTTQGYCNGMVDPDTGQQPVAGTTTTATQGIKFALPATDTSNGYVCSGGSGTTTTATTSGANRRNYAVVFWSENANAQSCIDNR